MLRALLYLRFTSFKNWVLTRVRALRKPKQLAGALAFALYFWFFFLRHWTSGPRISRQATAAGALQLADTLPAHWLPVATAVGALALFVLIALMWIVPTQRAALGFSEAEIAFLFPAPVTREALVHFRLLSGQFRSLVGATIMMLISNRWSFLGGNAATHALGWWFVFSALNLHYGGASFTLTRLSDLGLGAVRRRIYVLLLVALTIGVTLARLPAAERLPAAGDAVLRPFTDWIIHVTSTAPLSWALWPFKLVVGPFLAPDPRAFFLALAPALLVIVTHYLWVVRSAVAFEESSIDFAQKRGARLAAWRSGQRQFGAGGTGRAQKPPFRLAGVGRPELAFLWKNLLSTWPYFRPRLFLACVVVIVAGCRWLDAHPAFASIKIGLGATCGGFAIYLLIFGPHFARQDIRSDLTNADILKTYPLLGWQIVLGEILAPAAILTGLLWLLFLTAALAFQPQNPFSWFDVPFRITVASWLALIIPAIVTLQLLVPNAAALVFPGWVNPQRARGAGPEVAGQRMIFFFAQVVTMVIALLPAALFSALLVVIMCSPRFFDFSLPLALNIAAVPMFAILVGEIWCGLWLLGQRFEKFDLSAELRP